jgi:CRP-like cAMP-binding protein
MSKAETVSLLRSVPLFSSCSGRQLRQIVGRGWEQRFEPGDDLCVQDELADEFYVLLEGTATVRRSGRKIGTLSGGDYFGEIALLRTLIERSRRTATVRAITPVRCFVLSRSGFHEVLHVEDIAVKILEAVVPRLAATSAL